MLLSRSVFYPVTVMAKIPLFLNRTFV